MSLHYIIGVVEVIVHPGYKAEFDKMGDMLGTLIDDIVPLIESCCQFHESDSA